jgi:NAD(P)-dependent dehydrogenase (short-subunit alcohol dehydrogenase family)
MSAKMFERDDFTNCVTNVRLEGKVAIVTGATSGVGLEVAKNLAQRGAKVIIASRNQVKLDSAKEEIVKSTGNDKVITKRMDFESLASVRNFVDETIITEPRVDILINNIGAIGLPDKLTEDNLHTMMQVNYFGAFLLTYLLFPLLKASAPSRIVNVSSMALILGDINIDHLNDVGRYSNFGYYCNAKLADVLFTVEMEKRIRGSDVSIYSMDPGLIKTEFFRNSDNEVWKNFFNHALSVVGRRPERVATMHVYLAVDPKFENSSGKHFRDCGEFFSHLSIYDTELNRRLWDVTKKLVHITEDEEWDSNISNFVNMTDNLRKVFKFKKYLAT